MKRLVLVLVVVGLAAVAWWFRYTITVLRVDRAEVVLLIHDHWTSETRVELRGW